MWFVDALGDRLVHINTKFHEVLDFLSKAYDCLNEPYVRDTLHLI